MDRRVRRNGSSALHLFVHFISTIIYIRSTSDHQALGTPDIKNPLERYVKVFKSEWIAR